MDTEDLQITVNAEDIRHAVGVLWHDGAYVNPENPELSREAFTAVVRQWITDFVVDNVANDLAYWINNRSLPDFRSRVWEAIKENGNV